MGSEDGLFDSIHVFVVFVDYTPLLRALACKFQLKQRSYMECVIFVNNGYYWTKSDGVFAKQ